MTSPATQDAYMIIRYFKRMRDHWDIEEDDAVNNYTHEELGLYNYYSCIGLVFIRISNSTKSLSLFDLT